MFSRLKFECIGGENGICCKLGIMVKVGHLTFGSVKPFQVTLIFILICEEDVLIDYAYLNLFTGAEQKGKKDTHDTLGRGGGGGGGGGVFADRETRYPRT